MKILSNGRVKLLDEDGILFCPYADNGNGETVTIAQNGKKHVVLIDYLLESLYRLRNIRKSSGGINDHCRTTE